MKAPERRQWSRFGAFIVNFEQISHCSRVSIFFFIWVFFHEHSRITGLQGEGEDISLTYYHFRPLHKHLDINQAITADISAYS